MYIQLTIWNPDTLTVKFIFDGFVQTPSHRPVIFCRYPYTKPQGHCTFCQFIYLYQHSLIFPGALVIFYDLFQYLLCLVHI